MFVGCAAIVWPELERFVGPIAASRPITAHHADGIGPDLTVQFWLYQWSAEGHRGRDGRNARGHVRSRAFAWDDRPCQGTATPNL